MNERTLESPQKRRFTNSMSTKKSKRVDQAGWTKKKRDQSADVLYLRAVSCRHIILYSTRMIKEVKYAESSDIV